MGVIGGYLMRRCLVVLCKHVAFVKIVLVARLVLLVVTSFLW